MTQRLGSLTFLVRDYDEAIAYFVQTLGFELLQNEPLGQEGKRWVRVAPAGGKGTALLLARAANPEQQKYVGIQGGGRVFLFLETDNFSQDYAGMKARGVKFLEEPRAEAYGRVVVFADLYGNKWDLLETRLD